MGVSGMVVGPGQWRRGELAPGHRTECYGSAPKTGWRSCYRTPKTMSTYSRYSKPISGLVGKVGFCCNAQSKEPGGYGFLPRLPRE